MAPGSLSDGVELMEVVSVDPVTSVNLMLSSWVLFHGK